MGKTAVLQKLDGRIGTVDADDIVPPENNTSRATAIGLVGDAVAQQFEAGYPSVVLAWVFARAELFAPFEARFKGNTRRAYLVAQPQILKQRLSERGQPDKWAYSCDRLARIQALAQSDPNLPLIDTSNRSIQEVLTDVYAQFDG